MDDSEKVFGHRQLVIFGPYPASMGKTESILKRAYDPRLIAIEFHGNRAKRRADLSAARKRIAAYIGEIGDG